MKEHINDQYPQKWREEISSLSKMRTYKSDFSMEKCLSLPSNLRSALAIFRLSCHSLLIETGCYIRPPEKRLCQVCKVNVIKDEKLFLLQCVTTCSLPEFDSLILVATKNIPNFSHLTLDRKFKELMTKSRIFFSLARLIYIHMLHSFVK